MAGLADLNFDEASRVIKLPNGASFTVRGLALSDITRLIRGRSGEIEGYFQHYMGAAEEGESPDPKFRKKKPRSAISRATKFSGDLLGQAPDLAAEIIAYASDEPTFAVNARRLPFPVQLEALEAIADLTFVGDDGIKKAVETVIRMLGGATDLMQGLNQPQITLPESETK